MSNLNGVSHEHLLRITTIQPHDFWGSIHALIWVAVLLVLVQMTFALLLSQAGETAETCRMCWWRKDQKYQKIWGSFWDSFRTNLMFMSFSHPILLVHVDFRIFAATIIVWVVLNVGRCRFVRKSDASGGGSFSWRGWQYGFSRDHVDGVSIIQFLGSALELPTKSNKWFLKGQVGG